MGTYNGFSDFFGIAPLNAVLTTFAEYTRDWTQIKRRRRCDGGQNKLKFNARDFIEFSGWIL